MDVTRQVMLSRKWLKKPASAAKCSGSVSLADMVERDAKQSCERVLYHDKVYGWLSRNYKSTLGIALTH